jgi:hypothetical protein
MTASLDFDAIPSPIIFRGDSHTAYRDPAAIFHDGTFHLFFTLATITEDGTVFLRIADPRRPFPELLLTGKRHSLSGPLGALPANLSPAKRREVGK